MREGCEFHLDTSTDMTSGFPEVPGEEVRERSGLERENGSLLYVAGMKLPLGREEEEARSRELRLSSGGRWLQEENPASEQQKCGWEPRGFGVWEAR